ncbi:MAG: hypothetical protein KGJ07_06560, partial [Patescibacteria group bacterium]|nr:hypothetical protein [Patescibacteria group bacterium]
MEEQSLPGAASQSVTTSLTTNAPGVSPTDTEPTRNQPKRPYIFVSLIVITVCLVGYLIFLYSSLVLQYQHFTQAVRSNTFDVGQAIEPTTLVPGNMFYLPKLLAEKTYSYFLNSPTEKVLFSLFQANERIAEINTLSSHIVSNTHSLSLLTTKVFAQTISQQSFDTVSPETMLSLLNSLASSSSRISQA